MSLKKLFAIWIGFILTVFGVCWIQCSVLNEDAMNEYLRIQHSSTQQVFEDHTWIVAHDQELIYEVRKEKK
jgi:hypothetical protein